jgi:hypothetical protein
MKKATFAVHSIASLAALAGIASATLFGVNELNQGRGLAVSQLTQGSGGSNLGPSLSSQVYTPQSYNGPSLPVPSALILLGASMAGWGLAAMLSRRTRP